MIIVEILFSYLPPPALPAYCWVRLTANTHFNICLSPCCLVSSESSLPFTSPFIQLCRVSLSAVSFKSLALPQAHIYSVCFVTRWSAHCPIEGRGRSSATACVSRAPRSVKPWVTPIVPCLDFIFFCVCRIKTAACPPTETTAAAAWSWLTPSARRRSSSTETKLLPSRDRKKKRDAVGVSSSTPPAVAVYFINVLNIQKRWLYTEHDKH